MANELRKVYEDVVEPVEKEYAYDLFKPSYFNDTLTCSTPLVLFIGVLFILCFFQFMSSLCTAHVPQSTR